MKKLVIGLTALFVASVVASNASAALSSKKATSLNFNITFTKNILPITLDVYTAKTGGTKLTDVSYGGVSFYAADNKRRMIRRAYVQIQPQGLYEVAIYTNNLDKNNDGQVDTSIDLNGDGTTEYTRPSTWSAYTSLQKSNYIGGYAGLYHSDYPNILLPVKVWSLTTAGQLTEDNDTLEKFAPPVVVSSDGIQSPDNDDQINDYNNANKEWAWYGNSKTVKPSASNYNPGSYSYIPEKLAIDTSLPLAQQIEGSYTKKIAGTIFGTNITERQEIAFGVDQLFAGSGVYKGKVYLDLRGN